MMTWLGFWESAAGRSCEICSPSPLLYDTYYHIYNRGVNSEDIFAEERNYDLFLRLYEKHLSPVTDLFGYCLLKNHFHFSVRIKSEAEILETEKTLRVSPANGRQSKRDNSASQDECQSRKPLGSHYVSDQFSNFFNAYAKTINKAYGRTGSLFQHPFGRIPITSDRQFWNVIAYTCESTIRTRKNMDLSKTSAIGNTRLMTSSRRRNPAW
jgi:putative transposase